MGHLEPQIAKVVQDQVRQQSKLTQVIAAAAAARAIGRVSGFQQLGAAMQKTQLLTESSARNGEMSR